MDSSKHRARALRWTPDGMRRQKSRRKASWKNRLAVAAGSTLVVWIGIASAQDPDESPCREACEKQETRCVEACGQHDNPMECETSCRDVTGRCRDYCRDYGDR